MGNRDFMSVLKPYPGLARLPREDLIKIVYLRDKRALPDEIKRLFDQAAVIPLRMEETRDVAEAMRFASGETAAVNLGQATDRIHYVRRSLQAFKDRDLSVDETPREDLFEGDVLPLFDGLLLDMLEFAGVAVDPEHEILRAEVGARWGDAFDAAEKAGRLLPLLPVLPSNPFVGDVSAGTAILTSFSGGPEAYLRNVDFLDPDTNYGQSGFDHVPNNATGYDLNALLLGMGRHIGVPLSLTLRLVPLALTRALHYTFEGWDDLLKALQALSRTSLRPIRVVFGDPIAATTALGGGEGYALEVDLGGTEETLAAQEKALAEAVAEETPKETREGLSHVFEGPTGKVPFHLAELRTSLVDLPPLWEELAMWASRQGSAFGMAGALQEAGSVSVIPFMRGDLQGTSTTGGPVDIVLLRGDRFDRVTELVRIARRHPCRVRNNQLTQLLAADGSLPKRFTLVRRIKQGVDLGNIINPSGLLWVPQPR